MSGRAALAFCSRMNTEGRIITNANAAAIPTNGRAKNGKGPHGPPASGPLPAVSDGVASTAINKAATPAASAQGRAKGGRFGPGNKFGRGNPVTRKLGTMRVAFLDAVAAENLQALARQLLEMALGGDLAAAALFLAYAVGKPGEAMNPDDADQEEFDRTARRPTGPAVANASSRRDPGIAAEGVRTWCEDSVKLMVSQIREMHDAERQAVAPKAQTDKARASSAADLAAAKAAAEMLMQAARTAANGKQPADGKKG
jgi:hypothetical protein